MATKCIVIVVLYNLVTRKIKKLTFTTKSILHAKRLHTGSFKKHTPAGFEITHFTWTRA